MQTFTITGQDDLPLHSSVAPVAQSAGVPASADKNFYDRYFFQGASSDGAVYFIVCMGFYRNIGVMDAAFLLQHQGVQHSVITSAPYQAFEQQLNVGGITIHIEQPLSKIHISVDVANAACKANLTFTALTQAVLEPRYTVGQGDFVLMDLLRMAQAGNWQGQLACGQQQWQVDDWNGLRDRSWGIRPLGKRAPPPPGVVPQWYWLWGAARVPGYALHFHTNDDANGNGWNRAATLVDMPSGQVQHLQEITLQSRYRDGSRQVAECILNARLPNGTAVELLIQPDTPVYLQGGGYNHPTHGHGTVHDEVLLGNTITHTSTLDVAAANPNLPEQMHLQAHAKAQLKIGDAETLNGTACFEQMLLGPYQPAGWQGVLGPV